MKRIRLTREQSKDQTRLRLLDAAQAIFMKKGFVAASVEDIAEAAGYTRGAFYSNFRSASEFFVELLRVKHRDIQDNPETLLRDVAVSSETVQQQFALLYARCHSSNVDDVVWAEARLQAERDVRLREHVEAMCVERRDMIARLVGQSGLTKHSVNVGKLNPGARVPKNRCYRCWSTSNVAQSNSLVSSAQNLMLSGSLNKLARP